MAPKERQLQLFSFTVSADGAALKEQRELMSRSWFSLQKKKRTQAIEHRFGENWVRITGDSKHGLATISDSLILNFATSHYIDALNNGQEIGRRFGFTAYEFFAWIGKEKLGGSGYKTLWAALERLHHTFVETNIIVGDARVHRSWNMLASIDQTIALNGKHRGYEVIFPEFFFENIKNSKNVLTLDSGYFNLTSSLDKFLYLYARKSAGKDSWSESIESLYGKSASTGGLVKFKRHIKKVIGIDHGILDYEMALEGAALVMKKRK